MERINRDTDAQPNRQLATLNHEWARHRLANLVGDHHGASLMGAGGDDARERVAVDPGDGIGIAGDGAQPGAHLLQQPIADIVA